MDPLPAVCPPTPPAAPSTSRLPHHSASQEHRRRHRLRRHRSHSDSMDDPQASPVLAPSPCAMDFQKELRCREGSTSTPFTQRSNGALTCSLDSGFGDVTSSFAMTCRIASPVTTTTTTNTANIADDDDLLPFPRISLEAVFTADEDDSAFVEDLSVQSSQHTSADSGLGSPGVLCAICRTTAARELGTLHCDACAAVVARYQPTCPDRLIGRRIGRDHVDIVNELARLDLSGPIAAILRNLSESDICRSCCVSTHWQRACVSDSAANRRRQQYCRQIRCHGKENDCRSRLRRQELGGATSFTKSNDPLANVQMVDLSTSSLLSKSSLSCSKVAQKLRSDESLRACPSCSHPARVHVVQERAQCTNEQCAFDFCITCRSAFHGSRDCVPSRRKKTRSDRATVCSRLSRQNLKRL